MKKALVIVFILVFAVSVLCACRKEADMVEDMVSTVLSTDNKNNDNNNGTVTDGDGYIGNEDNRATNDNKTESDNSSTSDNNVM